MEGRKKIMPYYYSNFETESNYKSKIMDLSKKLKRFTRLKKSTYIIYGNCIALSLYGQSLETLLESDCFDFNQKNSPMLASGVAYINIGIFVIWKKSILRRVITKACFCII